MSKLNDTKKMELAATEHKDYISAVVEAEGDFEGWAAFSESVAYRKLIEVLEFDRDTRAKGWNTLEPKDLVKAQAAFNCDEYMLSKLRNSNGCEERLRNARNKLREFEERNALLVVPWHIQREKAESEKRDREAGIVSTIVTEEPDPERDAARQKRRRLEGPSDSIAAQG